MTTRICAKCGELAYQECMRTHARIICEHCGFKDEIWDSGYDEGDERASTVDDDDEDEDDDDDLPAHWWDPDDEDE